MLNLLVGGETVPVFPTVVHMLNDDTAITEPGFPTQVMTRGPNGVRRDTVPLLRFDRSGQHTGIVGPIAAGETVVHDGSSMPLPFGHRLYVGTGPDVVYVGTGKSRSIEIMSPRGEVIGSIELPGDSRPVTDDDFDAMKQHLLARMAPAGRAATEEMLGAMFTATATRKRAALPAERASGRDLRGQAAGHLASAFAPARRR